MTIKKEYHRRKKLGTCCHCSRPRVKELTMCTVCRAKKIIDNEKYRKKNPKYSSEYYKEHKEYFRKYQLKFYKKHPRKK